MVPCPGPYIKLIELIIHLLSSHLALFLFMVHVERNVRRNMIMPLALLLDTNDTPGVRGTCQAGQIPRKGADKDGNLHVCHVLLKP